MDKERSIWDVFQELKKQHPDIKEVKVESPFETEYFSGIIPPPSVYKKYNPPFDKPDQTSS